MESNCLQCKKTARELVENVCKDCYTKNKRNATRRAKHQAYLDCGMVRVKGALGGTYYE